LGKEPEKESQRQADENRGGDREIKSGVFTAVEDIARKAAEAEGEFGTEVEKEADGRQDQAEDNQHAAEIAEGVHEVILGRTGW
jgi:hypothetical protein